MPLSLSVSQVPDSFRSPGSRARGASGPQQQPERKTWVQHWHQRGHPALIPGQVQLSVTLFSAFTHGSGCTLELQVSLPLRCPRRVIFSFSYCGTVDMSSGNICKVVDKLISASSRGFQSALQCCCCGVAAAALPLLRMKPSDSRMWITEALFVCLLPNHPASNNTNIKSTMITNTTDYNILLTCIKASKLIFVAVPWT